MADRRVRVLWRFMAWGMVMLGVGLYVAWIRTLNWFDFSVYSAPLMMGGVLVGSLRLWRIFQ